MVRSCQWAVPRRNASNVSNVLTDTPDPKYSLYCTILYYVQYFAPVRRTEEAPGSTFVPALPAFQVSEVRALARTVTVDVWDHVGRP